MTSTVGNDVRIEAVADLDADAFFRQHPRWRGADDAYSVLLPDGRVVWLMADGFVAEEGEPRAGSVFVNNTIGIQRDGSDPRTATLDMHWPETDEGRAIAYFRDPEPGHWFWPGHGAVVGGSLLMFLGRVQHIGGPPPWNFRGAGWRARIVDDWRGSPDDWQPREVLLPDDADLIPEGSGAALAENGWLYLYGFSHGGTTLTRWSVDDAARGDLRRPQWWDGDGWSDDSASRPPAAVVQCSPEFTVHYEPRLGGYALFECAGMDHGRLTVRVAPRLEGPWGEPRVVYTPPESGEPGRFLYAGKAHPHLRGADLWLTYVVNDHTPDRMVADESIYYPRFVRLTFHD
jgi:hypothetical protein